MSQEFLKRLLMLEREAAPVKGMLRRIEHLEARVQELENFINSLAIDNDNECDDYDARN